MLHLYEIKLDDIVSKIKTEIHIISISCIFQWWIRHTIRLNPTKEVCLCVVLYNYIPHTDSIKCYE